MTVLVKLAVRGRTSVDLSPRAARQDTLAGLAAEPTIRRLEAG